MRPRDTSQGMKLYRRTVLTGLTGLLTLAATRAMASESLRDLLRTPGVHAIMRHAYAPGTGDPPEFRLGDCATQRNLNGQGRAQAGAIGDRLRELGARFDEVRTSQWCRCRETAELLGLGTPVADPVLNSFFADRSTAAAQTEALRGYLAALPESARVLLVTHQVNITALTGRGVGSGELFLVTADPQGAVAVEGVIDISW